MDMKITAPESNTGDIISDLPGERARVLWMTPMGTLTTVEAQAPLAEVQHYSADLRSMTQGRGHFTISFSHYEEVPAHAAQKGSSAAEQVGGAKWGGGRRIWRLQSGRQRRRTDPPPRPLPRFPPEAD